MRKRPRKSVSLTKYCDASTLLKTKQDASSSRRVEYVAGSVLTVRDQNARKRNAEMRSRFFVLLVVLLLTHHNLNRRTREIIGAANGVFQISLVREV